MKGIDINTIDPILKKQYGGNKMQPTAEEKKRFHKIRAFIKKQTPKKK